MAARFRFLQQSGLPSPGIQPPNIDDRRASSGTQRALGSRDGQIAGADCLAISHASESVRDEAGQSSHDLHTTRFAHNTICTQHDLHTMRAALKINALRCESMQRRSIDRRQKEALEASRFEVDSSPFFASPSSSKRSHDAAKRSAR